MTVGALLDRLPKVEGTAGEVHVSQELSRLLNVTDKLAQQRGDQYISSELFALAALEDQTHEGKTKRIVDDGRTYLQEEFAEMKLAFIPSAGNFIMVNVGDGPGIFEKLLTRKIIVRPLKGYNLPEWIRISIGTMEQNRKCIAALKEVLPKDRPN